jgi:hypothetical protein
MVEQYIGRLYYRIYSGMHPIIQCCREVFIQRYAWKVHEITNYMDKDVVVRQVHDDNRVLFLRGFEHIGELGDDKRSI